MNNKHLTSIDRSDIEAGLNKGKSITEISKSIHRPYNTVKKEIIVHREKRYPSDFNGKRNLCLYFINKTCSQAGLCSIDTCHNRCMSCKRHFCNELCPNYTEYLCDRIVNKPYCCNGCIKYKICRNIKMLYTAKSANSQYHDLLSKSRSGHRLTKEEIDYANNEVYKRIKNGQSLDSIIKTDNNIKGCTSSYYNYTNAGIFKFRNIDLRKKVSYKHRKNKKSEQLDNMSIKNSIDKLKVTRSYEKFITFINKHPNFKIAEMDTVIGKKADNKVLLTLLFRRSNFMIARLLPNKKAETISEEINKLKKKLSTGTFIMLFRILLTDNGVEFTLIEEIENMENNNNINLFFCDPGRSNQKGKIEKNHVELRKIIPKGTTLEIYNQNDIDLAMSHINSYPRKLLKYKSPYEALIEEIGNDNVKFICKVLGYKFIPSKDIILSPKLLKKS